MVAQKKADHFKVLLADDSSDHARAAQELVGALPLPAGSEIIVLRAFASTQASDLSPLEYSLNQACARLTKPGLLVKSELMLGSPAEKIVEYAETFRPALIMVGAKGLRATFGILLGGVAQQVVEYACCPVLVVRAPYHELQTILLVSDGSPSSRLAMQYLGTLPLPAGLRVQVMHVLPPPPMPIIYPDTSYAGMQIATPEKLSEIEAALQANEEKAGRALLDQTINSLQTFGMPATGILKRGDAATEIIKYAKENKVDLIVTGARGLSHFRSWLMGSVPRKLVHYSGCSVLVVRSPNATGED